MMVRHICIVFSGGTFAAVADWNISYAIALLADVDFGWYGKMAN